QMAQGMGTGQGGGAGGMASEMAIGMAMAQQMMQQQGGALGAQATPSAGAPPPLPSAATATPALLSPAEAAQALGVSEADVLQTLEAGDLKGKKIGATW